MHGQARTLGSNLTAYDLAHNNDRLFTAAVMSDFFLALIFMLFVFSEAPGAVRENPRDRPEGVRGKRVGTQEGPQGR